MHTWLAVKVWGCQNSTRDVPTRSMCVLQTRQRNQQFCSQIQSLLQKDGIFFCRKVGPRNNDGQGRVSVYLPKRKFECFSDVDARKGTHTLEWWRFLWNHTVSCVIEQEQFFSCVNSLLRVTMMRLCDRIVVKEQNNSWWKSSWALRKNPVKLKCPCALLDSFRFAWCVFLKASCQLLVDLVANVCYSLLLFVRNMLGEERSVVKCGKLMFVALLFLQMFSGATMGPSSRTARRLVARHTRWRWVNITFVKKWRNEWFCYSHIVERWLQHHCLSRSLASFRHFPCLSFSEVV